MQHLNTFWIWKTVVNLKRRRELELVRQQVRVLEMLEESELSQVLKESELSQVMLGILGIQVLLLLVLVLVLVLEWMPKLLLDRVRKRERELVLEIQELDRPPSLRTPKSKVEVRQKSHIKGWLSKILLEEWRGELEALRYRWLKEGKPELWIKIMTGFHLLELLKAYLQIKVENRWLPKKKRS